MENKVHIWLDDERTPGTLALRVYATEPYQDIQWWWVKTVPAFKAAIAQVGIENIGFMALDHDLGVCGGCERQMRDPKVDIAAARKNIIYSTDQITYSSCVHNGDGTQLINWMEEHNIWPELPPTVHSYNPSGARRMNAVIDKHYATSGNGRS